MRRRLRLGLGRAYLLTRSMAPYAVVTLRRVYLGLDLLPGWSSRERIYLIWLARRLRGRFFYLAGATSAVGRQRFSLKSGSHARGLLAARTSQTMRLQTCREEDPLRIGS